MPDDISILEDLLIEMNAVSMVIDREVERQALCESEKYLNGNINDVANFLPLAVYYILRNLPSSLQIQFIESHFDYVKTHAQEIFLVGMESPKELSYYFSYEVIEKIYEHDRELFEFLIQGQVENIFYGFSHEDYLSYLQKFKSYVLKMKPYNIFHILEAQEGLLYHQSDFEKADVNNVVVLQSKYNEEFFRYFVENYRSIICHFSSAQLLRFVSHAEDLNLYKSFLLERVAELTCAFENMDIFELQDSFNYNSSFLQQSILFEVFFDAITKKRNIKDFIFKLNSDMIVQLYQTHKELFYSMTLLDWIQLCGNKIFQKIQIILDDYEPNSMSDLFGEDLSCWKFMNCNALEYIENKYRVSLEGKQFIPTEQIHSIFSDSYLQNLKYLQISLKNQTIQKNSSIYQENFELFVKYFQNKNVIQKLDDSTSHQLNSLFIRVIKGYPLTLLIKMGIMQDIATVNRLGDLKLRLSDFTVNQIEHYHVREYKQLLKMIDHQFSINFVGPLVLKLLFLVGFQNAKKILEVDHDYGTLEHLVGNVNVEDIVLDSEGNPVLNKKILHLLFSDFHRFEMGLKDKNHDVYKYFPRIFNEWEQIVLYKKDRTLKSVIDFLKSCDLAVTPNYYRLNQLFRYIGCGDHILKETFQLHDEILKRTVSTIPKIYGEVGEYTYEVLDLQDMNALTLGNLTSCCFTILGNGYSCLKHATTSQNGRVLVVKKGDTLLAHSWLWRNGNLLCLDNVEVSKTLYKVDFLDVYLDFAEKIIQKTLAYEGISECIQNVTIGRNKQDVKIVDLNNYFCTVSKELYLNEKCHDEIGGYKKILDTLPQPIEQVTYSDSKSVQYFIRGNGNVREYQSKYLYQDQREDILYFYNFLTYSEEYIKEMNDIVNSLRYIKALQNQTVSAFYFIDVLDYLFVAVNRDWYMIQFDDQLETFIYSSDERAYEEMSHVYDDQSKVLRMNMDQVI